MLEKMERINLLKDFYGPLLTDKQQDVLNLYYENDLSLSEIADHLKISRQAVYDIVKRAENALEDYEKRLGLAKRFVYTGEQLKHICALLNCRVDNATVNDAVKILKRVIDSM